MIAWKLIPIKYKLLGAGVLIALLMAGSAYAAYKYQENDYERQLSDLRLAHEKEINKINEAGTKAIQREKDWFEQVTSALHQQNEVMYSEYSKLKKVNDRYVADISSGKLRVFVPVKSCSSPNGVQSNSSGGSVVDAGRGTAELDPTFAGEVVGLTGEGDSAIKKLNACRAHVRTIENSRKVQPK